MEYRQILVNKESISSHRAYLDQVLALSEKWVEEKTCPSYQATQLEELEGSDLFVAMEGKQVVAYAMGNRKVLKEATSYNAIGDRAFELEELYVLPDFRNQSLGSQLFAYIETQLAGQVDLIGLTATSYRYQDLLRFYIDQLGMTFNHALLIKHLPNE